MKIARRVAFVVTVALLVGGLFQARPGPGQSGGNTRLLATMKELSSAQVAFAASCGGGGYAASLDQLKTPLFFDALSSWSNDRPGLSADMRVDLGPGRGAARGPGDCLGRPTTSAYYASATFRLKEWKGPSFAVATDGVIWRSETADPPREPFGAPAMQVK